MRRLDYLRAKENPPPSNSNKAPPSPARSNSTSSIESLPVALSKSSQRQNFSSSSGSVTPRYGPLSVSSASAPEKSPSSLEDPQERERRHAQRQLDVMEVTSLWSRLDAPTIGYEIVLATSFSGETVTMERREGRSPSLRR